MRYLVNIKYNGKDYYGFQKQNDKITIEGEIETALSKILNESVNIIGCSRTDKGVHANDFYFHFDTNKDLDLEKLKYSLNSLTSDNIFFRKIIKVSEEFHSRYSVKNKEYKYIINTNEYEPTKKDIELEYNKEINLVLLQEASAYLIGTHDFKSFTSDNEKENTIRTINYIHIENVNGIVNILVNADGFLKYMVRNIVGLLLEINENKKNIKDIPFILESKDRTKLGLCAPAGGLYLNKVNY